VNNVRNEGRGREEGEKKGRMEKANKGCVRRGAGKPYTQILPRVSELLLTKSPPLAFPSLTLALLDEFFRRGENS